LRVNTVELYARYKAEQQTLTATRGQALEQARRRKDRLVEAAKRSNRLRRATIKVIGESGPNKKLLYAQASKALRDEIQAINKQYQQDRQALYDSHSRRTWADWLKKEATHGNAEALTALRAREAAQGLQGNTIQGQGDARPGHAPVTDNITKKGTIIFRAGHRPSGTMATSCKSRARPRARAARSSTAGDGTLRQPHHRQRHDAIQGAGHPRGR
jgi:cellobiose-specific phosphotransferase system component IIA